MKKYLNVILIICFIFNIFAGELYSHNTKIQTNVENIKVENVLPAKINNKFSCLAPKSIFKNNQILNVKIKNKRSFIQLLLKFAKKTLKFSIKASLTLLIVALFVFIAIPFNYSSEDANYGLFHNHNKNFIKKSETGLVYFTNQNNIISKTYLSY